MCIYQLVCFSDSDPTTHSNHYELFDHEFGFAKVVSMSNDLIILVCQHLVGW